MRSLQGGERQVVGAALAAPWNAAKFSAKSLVKLGSVPLYTWFLHTLIRFEH